MSKGSGGTRATNSRSAHATALQKNTNEQTIQAGIDYRNLERINAYMSGYTGGDTFAQNWNRAVSRYQEREIEFDSCKFNLEYFDRKHKDKYLAHKERSLREELVDRLDRARKEYYEVKDYIDKYHYLYVERYLNVKYK